MTNDNSEIYKSLNEKEGLKLPSYMGIIPREKDLHLDNQKIKEALENNKEFEVKEAKLPAEEEVKDDSSKRFSFEIKFEGTVYDATISINDTKNEDFTAYSFANSVDKESLDIAMSQPYYVEVTTTFSDDPMMSFLFQLKALHTIVPNAALVVDFSSMRLLSPHWLKMSAESDIPPSPNYLYIIHAVYDEKNGEKFYWMHTHGLHRCGSMELELVNIKSGANEMHNLINTAANLFIMEHYKENESFRVGYDGMGIHLCWLRWEEAINDFPKEMLGGRNDRVEEDGSYNAHAEPSGILFAVEDGNYTSPEIFATSLADNPIFFIRTDETLRMSALAKERFHMFEETYRKHAPKAEEKKSFLGKLFNKKTEVQEWRFLVKLGLTTDDAKEGSETEHLWFDVLSIDGKNVKGKLLNQPYWIVALNEGDIHSYPISEVLTDWVIYSPESSYTPDSIYMLYV